MCVLDFDGRLLLPMVFWGFKPWSRSGSILVPADLGAAAIFSTS